MKVNKLVINGYVIDCGGWFDFDEELRQTSVKIDWGKSESDIITNYLHLMFKHSANQDTGEICSASVNIVAHCDGFVFVHKPYEMISGANGNAREFIFKGGFVEAMKEEQPKRVKYEYVKVDKGTSVFTLSDDYHNDKLVDSDKNPVQSEIHLMEILTSDLLYRRIETEITERDEFIEAMSAILPEFDKRTIPSWIGRIYDSGKFKLVEGE